MLSLAVNSYATELVPSKVKLGIYERIRYEYMKNISDLNSSSKDNRSYFRFKTSPSLQYDFTEDMDIYTRLTNENRAYTYWAGSSASAGKSAKKKGYHYDINETVFDNLYFDWKNIFEAPVDLRIGRQDLAGYGEGFIFKQGTPLDGTRTGYFNAGKLSWKVNEKNTLDLIAIRDTKSDVYLPVINELDPRQALNSSNEYAFSLYHKTDSIKNLHWENYYVYKHEDASQASSARMTREETKLSTIGTYLKYNFDPSLALRGQIAGQFGDYGDNNRTGLGGYLFADKDFKDATWSPQLSVGAIYLSGNNRSTSTNETWDPLFSRDTWHSVLYASYFSSETEASYWANLQMYRASVSVKPVDKIKLSLWYNYLRANNQVAATRTLFSGTGRERGHLPQARVDYSITKNINTYFLAEYFIPGDFYVKSADDALFLRWELTYKY
jgi:hypothetical protein